MIRNPALRRARVAQVITKRLAGESMQKIANDLNLNHDTIRKDMKYATQHGMIESLEDRVLNELVPLAIDTFIHKMKEDHDPFVAKTVLEQLARLSTRADRQKEITAAVDSLSAYRANRNRSLPTVTVSDPTTPKLLEGEITNAG